MGRFGVLFALKRCDYFRIPGAGVAHIESLVWVPRSTSAGLVHWLRGLARSPGAFGLSARLPARGHSTGHILVDTGERLLAVHVTPDEGYTDQEPATAARTVGSCSTGSSCAAQGRWLRCDVIDG